jgi:hypothetical protein
VGDATEQTIQALTLDPALSPGDPYLSLDRHLLVLLWLV